MRPHHIVVCRSFIARESLRRGNIHVERRKDRLSIDDDLAEDADEAGARGVEFEGHDRAAAQVVAHDVAAFRVEVDDCAVVLVEADEGEPRIELPTDLVLEGVAERQRLTRVGVAAARR